jgi:hypothetical protein
VRNRIERTRTRFLEINSNELDSGSNTPRFALILGEKEEETERNKTPQSFEKIGSESAGFDAEIGG